MAAPADIERLRYTRRSLLVAVAMFGATLALLRLFASATRVIGWIVAAGVVAGLLLPVVWWLSRRMPRGAAVAITAVTTLVVAGGVTYLVVDDIRVEANRLEASAPEAARELERSQRFGDLARDLKVVDRTERFMDELPQRLQGGTAPEALRAAATRGVAFLATGVLTLFLLLHGPRIAAAGLRQVHDPARRRRIARVVGGGYRRAVHYVDGTIAMAIAASLVAWLLARAADLPGPMPLALWVALWDVIPVVGAFLGGMPLVLLAAAFASPAWAIVIALVLFAYQVFEATVLQRRIERASVHVGPFLTVFAALVGVELYGLGGALIAVVAVALAVAIAEEASVLGPLEEPAPENS